MKKLISFWPVAAVVFALIMWQCNPRDEKKPPVIVPPITVDTTKHLPDVVLENPNMDNYSNELNARRKPPRPKPKPGDPLPPVVTPANGCLLLDFNGQSVSGTLWSTTTIICASSGLSLSSEQMVFDRVVSYFAIFTPYILVTRDEAVFNSYPQNKRRRIIITSTMPDGYQGAGGVAYVNSFSWFDDSPAFVNSAGLGYDAKNISDATAHEAGHCLGNRHQSDWRFNADGSCYKAGEYLWGDLIMGASYNSPLPRWGIGPNSLGCTVIQNDTAVIFETLRR